MPVIPTTDDELKSRVRATTLYEDTPDELPADHLSSLLNNAKMRLQNRTGVSNWYGDDGLTQALLYATALSTKVAIENYSVTRWDVGAGEIDVSGASDTESAQFQMWANYVSEGLSASDSEDVASTGTTTSIVSDGYMP